MVIVVHQPPIISGNSTSCAHISYYFSWFRQQKPLLGEAVSMPAPPSNPAFTMTTLPNLKILIMSENGQVPAYDGDSDEVVMESTACYNISNSAASAKQGDHIFFMMQLHCCLSTDLLRIWEVSYLHTMVLTLS